MNVKTTRLANGAIVVTSSLPHVESVTMGIWIRLGGRYETPETAGISHFIEHLLFKGTKKRSSKVITQDIEGKGGYVNAFTQEESTCFYARIVHDKLDCALDVLSDMYLNSVLDPKEIEKERSVIVEEIMMYRDQPHHVVQDMLTEALWKDHPLGMPVIGWPETVKTISRKTLRDHIKKYYVPSNTVFAFAGKLEHEQCVDMVNKVMARRKGSGKIKTRKVTAKTGQTGIVLQKRDFEQGHLAMGVRVFGRGDERRYALKILNAVLGENMSSRLFQVVREKHGLAYSVHSSCHLFEDTGALVISAGLDKTRKEKAAKLIVTELSRLKNKPVGKAELRRAKDYITGQMRLSLESTSHQMMWAGDNIISYGRYIPPASVIEKLSKVTAEDIQSLARAIFRKSKISFALVSPDLEKSDKAVYNRIISEI